MNQPVKAAEQSVRRVLRQVARVLDRISGGRLTPNMVTLFGFGMHVPIALLVATGQLRWAALLLVVFGLFDALDGELARLQKRESNAGGFLDATTDRFKEVLLYTAAMWLLAGGNEPRQAVWAAAAVGASICVSYVKAKGEAVVASGSNDLPYPVLNRMFSGGLFSFQIRMAVLVLGLGSGYVYPALIIIAVCSALTAVQRLVIISRSIR